MVFETLWAPSPDCARAPDSVKARLRDLCEGGSCHACLSGDGCEVPSWPSECPGLTEMVRDHCLEGLDKMLDEHGEQIAAIVVEPVMQGAAGMICQPRGYLRGVADLAKKHGVLLIADEVAVGFGRTGRMFACEHEQVEPDLMCLAKGITGGYLPLAATMISDEIDEAFCGALEERKTFFHGHTYTGNPLACAAALASLDLFAKNDLIARSRDMAKVITSKLKPLQECPNVLDIRQRGLMTGIEICQDRASAQPFDFASQIGHKLCDAMRAKGVIVRPLGSVLILMPMPAMQMENLERLLDVVVETILEWDFADGLE
jgi:adenosylmethionine-8-amino-7-oxononanoate aminotransferase